MKRFSLAYKLVLSFSFFVLFAIASIVVYSSVEMKAILKDQIQKDLIAIAEGTEGQIFIFFEKIKMQSADWSSDVFVRQQIEELVKTNNQDFAKSISRHFLKNKLPIDSLVVVADILNVDMKTIASSDEKRVGIDEFEHAEGKSKKELMALKYGEALISQVMIEQASEIAEGVHPEYPVFHSLTPIKSADNETTIGFLLLHFSAENLNKIMGGSFQVEMGALSGQEFILNQKTAEMFLVDKNGLMITPSRFIDNAVLNQKIDNPATQACFNDKKEYSGSYVGYLGKEVQVASMCLDRYGIALLTEIETDEIFVPIVKERNDIGLMGFGIWLVSIGAVYLFSKFFLRDIKIIRNVAREVIKNNYQVRANVKSRDEIGELAQVFNRMLNNIQKEDRFIVLLKDVAMGANEAKSIEEVFQIVIDRICVYENWSIGHVYILKDDVSNILIPTKIWHFSDFERFKIFKEVTERTNFAKGEGLPGRILESKSPAWISDIAKDSNFPRAKLLKDINIVGAFGFPIISEDGNVIAVFEFFSEEPKEEEIEFSDVIRNVSFQISRVMERILFKQRLEEKIKSRTEELENIKGTLELRVHEKTMELQKRLDDLEKFKKLTMGRELRMIELKDEIDSLKMKINEKSS